MPRRVAVLSQRERYLTDGLLVAGFSGLHVHLRGLDQSLREFALVRVDVVEQRGLICVAQAEVEHDRHVRVEGLFPFPSPEQSARAVLPVHDGDDGLAELLVDAGDVASVEELDKLFPFLVVVDADGCDDGRDQVGVRVNAVTFSLCEVPTDCGEPCGHRIALVAVLPWRT